MAEGQRPRAVQRRTRPNGEVSTLRNSLRIITDRLFDTKRLLAQFLDESGYLSEQYGGGSAADVRQKQLSLVDALNAAAQAIAAIATISGAELRGAKSLVPVPPRLCTNNFNPMAVIRNSLGALLSHVQWISGLAAADDLEVEGVGAVRKTFSIYQRRSVLMSRQWTFTASTEEEAKQMLVPLSAARNPLTGINQSLHQALTSALGSVKALVDIALDEVKASLVAPLPATSEPIYVNIAEAISSQGDAR